MHLHDTFLMHLCIHTAGLYADLVAAVTGIILTSVVVMFLIVLTAIGYCLIRKPLLQESFAPVVLS